MESNSSLKFKDRHFLELRVACQPAAPCGLVRSAIGTGLIFWFFFIKEKERVRLFTADAFKKREAMIWLSKELTLPEEELFFTLQ